MKADQNLHNREGTEVPIAQMLLFCGFVWPRDVAKTVSGRKPVSRGDKMPAGFKSQKFETGASMVRRFWG